MNNRLEKFIELSSWIVTSVILIKLVPKNRLKEAQVSFLFKQLITWLFGLIVVEKKLISYPYRQFFKKANKASFTFEYFVYPALCSIFNLYFPEKKHVLIKIFYYIFHTSIITGFEVFAERYTNLIHYKKWSWQYSFITIWCTYFLSRIYFKWFFYEKNQHKEAVSN